VNLLPDISGIVVSIARWISSPPAWLFDESPANRHGLNGQAHLKADSGLGANSDEGRTTTMAQRVQVLLIDDVDDTEGAETVTFALDGVTYEIDLSERNAAALREAFAPWVGHARRVSGSGRSSGSRGNSGGSRNNGRKSSSSGNDTAAIREWARQNGHTVSERGRISAAVRDAYASAHA
jgi:hypothetical protein